MTPPASQPAAAARITLRPIGSPLPLGAFALVPSGLLLAGLQLGWFATAETTAIPLLLLGFAVPLQLVSSVLAFLGRDALVGTGFGSCCQGARAALISDGAIQPPSCPISPSRARPAHRRR